MHLVPGKTFGFLLVFILISSAKYEIFQCIKLACNLYSPAIIISVQRRLMILIPVPSRSYVKTSDFSDPKQAKSDPSTDLKNNNLILRAFRVLLVLAHSVFVTIILAGLRTDNCEAAWNNWKIGNSKVFFCGISCSGLV